MRVFISLFAGHRFSVNRKVRVFTQNLELMHEVSGIIAIVQPPQDPSAASQSPGHLA